MKVVRFFVKILSYLFVLMFGVLCLVTTMLLMVKNMSSYENISAFINDADIFDYSSHEVNDNSTLRSTIEKKLVSMNVPNAVTDEVLDSKELNDVLSSYIKQYLNYLVSNKNKPIFPSNDILIILEEKYLATESKSLTDTQKKSISEYLVSLGNKIDTSIFDKNEANEVLELGPLDSIVSIFEFKYIQQVVISIMILLFVILSISLSSIKRGINWCGKMIALDGIILIVLSFLEVRFLITFFNSRGLIDNLAILVVEQGFQNMLLYGGILIGIGLLLIAVSVILLKREKNNNSDAILDEIVDSEIEKAEHETSFNKEEKEEDIKKENTIIEESKEEVEDKSESKNDQEIVEKQEVDTDTDKDTEKKDIDTEKKDIDKENDTDSKNKELLVQPKIVPAPIEEIEVVPVPVPEKALTVFEKEPEKKQKEDKQTLEKKQVVDEDSDVVKKEITIKPLESIKVEVVSPKKGKDVEFNPDDEIKEQVVYSPNDEEEDDEDIELL